MDILHLSCEVHVNYDIYYFGKGKFSEFEKYFKIDDTFEGYFLVYGNGLDFPKSS